jgi:putative sugar O-methyltransferase
MAPALPRGYLTRLLPSFVFKPAFVGSDTARSASDNGTYVRAVERANRDFKAFSKFKRNAHYRLILEHATYDQGKAYLELLHRDAPDFLQGVSRFLVNDAVGGPIRFSYPETGPVSPTTLRYMKVASDIRKAFGDLNGFKVAEIGVGYGGQFLVLDQVFRFSRYDLFDLPPVLELTSKYLESHLLNSPYHTSTLNRFEAGTRYDLVISNYAFSELPAALQLKYIEKVVAGATCGYLTMNSGRGTTSMNVGKLSLEELRKLLPAFEIMEEEPLSKPDNYIIVWGRKQ